MIGEEFTGTEFVKVKRDGTTTFRCIPVHCTKDGMVTGNVLVVGDELTGKPELLPSGYSAFTNEEQCEAAGSQKFAFDITCKTDSSQLELQGQHTYGFLSLCTVFTHVRKKWHTYTYISLYIIYYYIDIDIYIFISIILLLLLMFNSQQR